jgi:tetratricopeptide (TPR) repeat protein
MSTPPSSYEAYRALADANLAFVNNWPETERLARKSLALDSSYQSARVALSQALLNLGKMGEADSILRIVESEQSGLSPAERAVAEWQRGVIDGDHAKMYRAAKRMAEVEPSMLALWILSAETTRDNRPAEALRILERVDPRSIQMEHIPSYWRTKTDAQHLLARHDLELVSARAGRVQYPANLCTLYLEAIALAALKRTTEAEQRLQESVDLQPRPNCGSQGELATVVALELRAHGDSSASRRASAWATHWYESLPRSQQLSRRREYANALYAAERWLDARRVVDELCRDTPSALDCLGLSGAIAARLGERDKAQQIADQISKLPFYPPRQEGDALLMRSKIVAALGNKELAVTLLRQSLVTGIYFSTDLHRDPDLQLLLGFPAFDKLLQPAG